MLLPLLILRYRERPLISWVGHSRGISDEPQSIVWQGNTENTDVFSMCIFTHIYICMSPRWRRSTCLLPLHRVISLTVTVTNNSFTSDCRQKNMTAHRYDAEDDPRGSAHNGVISPTGWKVSVTSFYSHLAGFNRFATCITTVSCRWHTSHIRPSEEFNIENYLMLSGILRRLDLPTFRRNVLTSKQHVTQDMNPGF